MVPSPFAALILLRHISLPPNEVVAVARPGLENSMGDLERAVDLDKEILHSLGGWKELACAV